MQSFLLEINPAVLTVDAAESNHIKLDVVAVPAKLHAHPDQLKTAGK